MEEYEIAYEENGQITYLGGKIVLKNKLTGNLVAAAYDDENTRVLLTLYGENQDKVGPIPLKPFKTEKEMWSFIAQEYSRMQNICVTPEQAQEMFNNVINKTKDVLNSRTSVTLGKIKILKLEPLKNKTQNDSSGVPEIGSPKRVIRAKRFITIKRLNSNSSFASPSVVSQVSENNPGTNTPQRTIARESSVVGTNPPRRRQKCIAEQIFDRLMESRERRFKIKEANRERRHKEKMRLLSELQCALLDMLNKKPQA